MMSPMTDYHFGYGSNLDLDDWKKWCDDHSRKSSEMQVEPGIFFLPDYELAFHYESGIRGGGALDVVKLRGHAVAGKLFKVTGDGWGSLDAKEGSPIPPRRNRYCIESISSKIVLVTLPTQTPLAYSISGRIFDIQNILTKEQRAEPRYLLNRCLTYPISRLTFGSK